MSKAKDSKNHSATIAFGSCNKSDMPQPLWPQIQNDNPDIWIWLGDNIYGDTNDMGVLASKYERQNKHESYASLKAKTEIIGIWDDHDYGINDGGKGYQQKKESQQLMLDFLDEPKQSVRRNQEGIYTTYNKKWGKLHVKFILLDTRYHRDTIYKSENGYIPNENGTILGDTQWQWLTKTLKESKADMNIIASSIQVIPSEHKYEKWANFPKERKRLFELIVTSQAKGVLLLSGDRHIAEVSKLHLKGMNYPLYEITSSGLTHTWKKPGEENNATRVSPLLINENYGLLKMRKKKKSVFVEVLLKGKDNEILYQQSINYRLK